MTIQQIYNLAIQMGINADLRGAATVKRKLQKEKEKFQKLSEEQKKEYDEERFTNPYADTRIYFGDPKKIVKRVLTGIDIETGEVMMAKYLSTHEKPIDLIIAHHPMGVGLAGLHEVMEMHTELLEKYGVPIAIAEGLTLPRVSEVSRSVSSANHNQTVDAARLLDMPIMSCHTACDNLVVNFLQKEIDKNKNKLERVEDVINLLKKIPEYQEAMKIKAGPTLFAGSPDRYAGKIALTEITGGTAGSKDIYEKLAQAGIGTVIGMHMKEEWKKEAEKAHINVIIAGHISSDSIGMNLFLDELEKRDIEIIPCSGLIRIKRFKIKKH
jgi:putative NIF3 family GTP cyclohydrolase 1 type 2